MVNKKAILFVGSLLDGGEEKVESVYHEDGSVEVLLPQGGSKIFPPED